MIKQLKEYFKNKPYKVQAAKEEEQWLVYIEDIDVDEQLEFLAFVDINELPIIMLTNEDPLNFATTKLFKQSGVQIHE